MDRYKNSLAAQIKFSISGDFGKWTSGKNRKAVKWVIKVKWERIKICGEWEC